VAINESFDLPTTVSPSQWPSSCLLSTALGRSLIVRLSALISGYKKMFIYFFDRIKTDILFFRACLWQIKISVYQR
jgi:hypothetical protein